MGRYKEPNLFDIDVKSVLERPSKVTPEHFAKPGIPLGKDFLDSLPDILQAAELKDFVHRFRAAEQAGKAIIVALGGHVIKCGLTPLLIEMMERGAVSCFAVNGSVTVHDYELAFFGKTSEDVGRGLEDGSFGMVFETTYGINSVITKASEEGLGYGEALGREILEKAPLPELSLLAMAYKHEVPATVHVALGTDITHQTPCADGKAIGDCSLRDFRVLIDQVMKLDDGGVFLNLGSAVVLPEVFLKALTVARNLSGRVKGFTTAVFDMNTHYRAMENVAKRPVQTDGKGFYFVGHHEIMLPLVFSLLRP